MRTRGADDPTPLNAQGTPALGPRRAADWNVRSTAGVELAVHDLGGEGPVVLCAHATGFHGQVWRPFAAHLPHHAIAPDLRGHGHSSAPPLTELHWDGFADDVLAVVDNLTDRGLGDPGQLVAVGHSKGGAALLRAEARRPGTFAALWVYEPIVFPPAPDVPATEHNPLAEGALRRRRTFPTMQDAIANYAAKPPLDALHPDALAAYVLGGFAPGPDGVELRCTPETEATVYRMGTRHDTFDRLGSITCPVAVVRGVALAHTPAAIAAQVAAALPRGELVEFDDLGHFGPLEDPSRTAAAAAGFLADALRP